VLGLQPQPVEARRGQQQAVHPALGQLRQARVDVAPEVLDPQVGTGAAQLRLAAEARGAHDRAAGELARVPGDEHVQRVGPLRHGGHDHVLGVRRGEVLRRVHREVDLARLQGADDLGHEQALDPGGIVALG
jgi:hypothetical protein